MSSKRLRALFRQCASGIPKIHSDEPTAWTGSEELAMARDLPPPVRRTSEASSFQFWVAPKIAQVKKWAAKFVMKY
jgi:hypothetical protein